MKKTMGILLLGSMLLLGGCADGTVSNATESENAGSQFVKKGEISSQYDYSVLEDKETGCMYLEGINGKSITPYYDATGKVKGCKESE